MTEQIMVEPQICLEYIEDDAQNNKPSLIEFDEESQQISEFRSDFSSQVYEQEGSIVSNETQKRKIEIRNKINQFLNDRKSLGMMKQPNRMTFAFQDDEPNGDILDQLALIEDQQKIVGETEEFILSFNNNPQKTINDYIKKRIIQSDEPQAIARYLMKFEGLDKKNLGEYFGENDPKVLKILHAYCKLLKLKKVEFDTALRMFLSKFRLPGESQQIERIVWQFSLAFYQSNEQDYDNADELFPLAYAIIMLTTDAHNPNLEKKMTKADFIKNTKGACPSIPNEELSRIYDRITSKKFETEINDTQNIYMVLKGIIDSGDFQKTLQLTKQLKKGDIFIKICANTIKMVQRKLYLSEDEKRIYWTSFKAKDKNQESEQQEDKQQARFIQIKDITDLTLGISSDVMKKNKIPKQFDSQCFTIQTIHRTLDLKAKTNKERAKWLNYIRAILIKRREAKIEEIEKEQNRINQRGTVQEVWNTDLFPNWDMYWDYKNKKPKVRNVIVRGIEAICCFWKKKPKTADGLEDEVSNHPGFQIKTTSKLEFFWGLGLPENSRKVLWPLVIGNNLAYNSNVIQQLKKKARIDQQLRKFVAFEKEVIQMAQVCRELRPDIPPIRQIILISELFYNIIPKIKSSSMPSIKQNNSANINNPKNSILCAFLNLVHIHHFLPFYRGDKTEIEVRTQLFEYLLQKNSLKVKKHFQVLKIETKLYLISWFLTAFADSFSYNKSLLYRIWDKFLLEGEIYLFKVGIAIVKYYEVQLKMCTFNEGLRILRFPKNTNPALFFYILNNKINVKTDDFNNYIDIRKHAIIKAKVQAIPLQ